MSQPNKVPKFPAFCLRKGVAIGLTDEQAWAALDGRKIVDAAKLLGVNWKIFYRKFPHLLKKRREARQPKTPFPSILGGGTWLTTEGYIREMTPGRSDSTSGGSMLQHRLAMSIHIGRSLLDSEVVHHKNGNRTDNRIENLELMTRLDHVHHHAEETLSALTESEVKKALKGRTTQEAATVLGVNHQTLRNRFDHLLSKRKSPVDPKDPAAIEAVRTAAADAQTGYRELAASSGICSQVAKQICLDNAIEWIPKARTDRKTPTLQ